MLTSSLKIVQWRKVWNVLHRLEQQQVSVQAARSYLQAYGLSDQEVTSRILQVQKDGHYLMSR